MSISVITPTEERPERLLRLYELLRAQEFSDWQWYIYDCSLRPCRQLQVYGDRRIHYLHDMERKSIGKRRNLLIKNTQSSYIVHFDDDDYYAPDYLSLVNRALKNCDLFHIHSWFAYHEGSRQYFYWDSCIDTPRRMAVNPLLGARIREMEFKRTLPFGDHGYGFSFAYKRELALEHPFLDRDSGEDEAFLHACKKCEIMGHADCDGVILRVIHEGNASSIYPQYMIPRFVMKLTHPHLIAYEDSHPSRR